MLKIFRKRNLFLWHRWLGIGMGALFVVWFVSGMIMMYSWYPPITSSERFERLRPIPLRAARFSPAQALSAAQVAGPARILLGESLGRPVYRLKPEGESWRAVWADSGEVVSAFSREQGAQIAAADFGGTNQPRFSAMAAPDDQWSGRPGRKPFYPLQKWAFDDARGTEIYISERTGSVVQRTTKWGRILAYPGTLIHLLNPVQIGESSGARFWILTLLSGLGVLLIGTGIWIGILRWRRAGYARRDGTRPKSPYRGTQKWHHYAGLTFGFWAFTWIGSGFLYMWWPLSDYPDKVQTAAFEGAWNIAAATMSPSQFAPGLKIKEAELVHFDGRPFWFLTSTPSQSQTVPADGKGAAFARFSQAQLENAARAAMPDAIISEVKMLSDFDFYYYSRQNFRVKRLPVLRVQYDDPEKLWLYIDPHTGSIDLAFTRADRAYRWLFRALHSFDWPGLINRRPLWDILMLFFALGGLWLSLTGVRLALHRVRASRRTATTPSVVETVSE